MILRETLSKGVLHSEYLFLQGCKELSVLDQQVAVTHCKVVTSGRGLMLDGLVTM